jgi:hypothetical protein
MELTRAQCPKAPPVLASVDDMIPNVGEASRSAICYLATLYQDVPSNDLLSPFDELPYKILVPTAVIDTTNRRGVAFSDLL